MKLQEMFKQIEDYQISLGGDIREASDQEKLDCARICSLALYQEVAELVDSFPFKPWREVSDQTMDVDNMEREVIDIIFFLAQITRCFGIEGQDLVERFDKVLANNKERIQNGYSKVKTVENGKNGETP